MLTFLPLHQFCFFFLLLVNSPRYPSSVFIFGDVSTGDFIPVGTCFAITSELLLTCQHNMQDRRLTDYAFALTCERVNGVVTCAQGWFPAKVLKFNREMDYALIESLDKKDLIPIPLSIGPVEGDLDVKVFHIPIDDFNDCVNDDQLSVHTLWIKSTLPSKHHMKCHGGLFAGSSGAPFVLRNGRVFGFYCESINSKREADIDGATLQEAVEILSDTVNSHAHNHASFCRALLIGACPKFVKMLGEHGVELYN
ncbi:MAG: serine protease [Chitinophagaceae bacterium]|nr:MAG: serine protease [Chitinophagaceae bacterium]